MQIKSGQVFCVACGNQLVDTAVICPKCGTPRAYLPAVKGLDTRGSKSKTTAVLLAVFLSAWTWLYSFKQDKTKFFVAVGMQLVASLYTFSDYLNFGIGYFDPVAYTQVATHTYLALFLNIVSPFLIWLWAVISAARKPARFE